jgi:uncharacterized protein (TIGR02600 family)
MLIVAFFSSITAENTSATSYASGAMVKQLADSAVQLAIAQVTDGTKGHGGGEKLAWASQPGMIRTYGTDGKPKKLYKLYSSDQLVISDGSTFDPAKEAPPSDWDALTKRGLFTDLNSPVVRNGSVFFPIIDPRAKSNAPNQSVEGFDYQEAVDGVVSPGSKPDDQRLPMPVKWLYVLQDGKIATPADSKNGLVTFDSSDPSRVPSKANPIVGRIAFWTDDETCKVNINTASEGTFWDRPWANTTTEQNFSTSIPGKDEFQRFPGHPAKNCLSTVFGPLLPSPSPAWFDGISGGQLATNQSQLKSYYDLIPRVADGGTKGGTINEADAAGNTNPAFTPVTPDADRLYASTDEFLYTPSRTSNNTVLNNSFLEKAKFFITAQSRAPELNVFGEPRMTIWPLQLDESLRNAKDKLIAFCSQIGGQPYYFQRYNTCDGSNQSAASSQSATLDWKGVPRNQTLWSYIDALTQENIPGFGGSFAAKYPDTRQQIITEMFDMIRSGVNAYSTALSPQYSYAPPYLSTGEGQIVPLIPPQGTPGAGTHGFGRFITITGAALNFFRSNPAYYTTKPSSASSNPVLTDSNAIDSQVNPNGVAIHPGPQIGVGLILNPFTPSPGFPPWSPNVTYVVNGLDQLTITSPSLNGTLKSFGFLSTLTNTVTSRAEYSGMYNCTPYFNILPSFRYAAGTGDGTKAVGFSDPVKQYPFAVPVSNSTNNPPPSSGIQLAESDKTFDFSGGKITVTIYSGSDTSKTTPIQTIQLSFPPVKGLRVPSVTPSWVSGTTTLPNSYATAGSTFTSRTGEGVGTSLSKPWRTRLIGYVSPPPALGNGLDTNGAAVNYYPEDVARGIEADANGPARGDYRVYAALSNIPSTGKYFTACSGTAYDVATPPGSTPPNGVQPYSNVQTLRDDGKDGGATGGFGYDEAFPGGFYTHYPNFGGGNSDARNQIATQTITNGTLIPKNLLAKYAGTNGFGSKTGDQEYRSAVHPAVPNGLNGAFMFDGVTYGDWDNATGQLMDGPFINKPDEGNSSTVNNTLNITNVNTYYGGNILTGGYFTLGFGPSDYAAESGATFSPNRQICSAVMFGSLPTGIDPTGATEPKPWQTLLFCPNPAANSSGGTHPGFGKPLSGPPYTLPPDHLLLDLFTMPAVEPYAISEPFSTAGKINMNYQILPFTYITRDTGVRAVLKSSRIMAIPQSASTVTSQSYSYKDGVRCKYEMRYDINLSETNGTLEGFERRFNPGKFGLPETPDIFRSASEICGIYLVPQLAQSLSSGMSYPPGSAPPITYPDTKSWWDNFLLTGDNTRESPYSDIYARLTTKSNTYTVHARVQVLKKVPGTPADQWSEGRDQVLGEYRSASTFERYIDTNDPTLPDFASDPTKSAEDYYRIRIIHSTTFTP